MKSTVTRLASLAVLGTLVNAAASATTTESACPSPEPCRSAVSFATPENADPAWDRFARELGTHFDDSNHPPDVGDEAPPRGEPQSSTRPTAEDDAASTADPEQLGPSGVRLMLLWRLLGAHAKSP